MSFQVCGTLRLSHISGSFKLNWLSEICWNIKIKASASNKDDDIKRVEHAAEVNVQCFCENRPNKLGVEKYILYVFTENITDMMTDRLQQLFNVESKNESD